MFLLAAIFGAGCFIPLITANLRSYPSDSCPHEALEVFFTPHSSRALVNLSGLPSAPPSLRCQASASAPNLLRASIVSTRWSVGGGVTQRNVATRGAELHNFPGDLLPPGLPGVVEQLPETQHIFKHNYG